MRSAVGRSTVGRSPESSAYVLLRESSAVAANSPALTSPLGAHSMRSRSSSGLVRCSRVRGTVDLRFAAHVRGQERFKHTARALSTVVGRLLSGNFQPLLQLACVNPPPIVDNGA